MAAADLRAYFGLSQPELATWLGMSRALLASVETGREQLPARARPWLRPWVLLLPAEDDPPPAAAPAWAQTAAPAAKSDQYAILTADHESKNRAELELLTGTAAFPTTPSQSQQAEEAVRVKAFEYEADALNYLSSRGWELVSVSTRANASGYITITRYYLRRRAQ